MRGVSRFARLLWSIAGVAFLLRLVVSWELASWNGGRNSVFFPSPLSDLHTYMELARQAAAGNFTGEFYYQPFYYAVFLPSLYLVSGTSTYAVILAQALLGAFAVYFAGRCGAEIWSRRAGLWAAGLAAVSTPLLLYTPFSQNETLQSFLLALLFFLTLKTRRNPSWIWALLLGAVAGAAILTRGNAWCFLPGIVLFLFWKRWNLRNVALVGIMLALMLAVQVPFAWRNTRLRGHLTGPSTAADAVLALGNTPEAPPGGRNPGLPAGPMEYPPSYQDFMTRAAAGRSVARQLGDWFVREPGAVLELYGRKFLLFFDYREIPNNVSLYGEGERSAVLRSFLFGRSGVLIALALGGMLLALPRLWRRRSPRLALLYYFVFAYTAATVVFYILSRFRAPILPLVAIFGGILVDTAFRFNPRERVRLLLPALLLGTWVAFCANDLYRDFAEAPMMRLVRPHGVRVEFMDGRTMFLDNGPFTNGNWCEILLKAGDRLQKKFDGLVRPGNAEWTLFSPEGAHLVVRVNGAVRTIAVPAGELFVAPFPVETLSGGVIELEIMDVRGEVFAFQDTQRAYGRSGDLPGELVIRFYTLPAP